MSWEECPTAPGDAAPLTLFYPAPTPDAILWHSVIVEPTTRTLTPGWRAPKGGGGNHLGGYGEGYRTGLGRGGAGPGRVHHAAGAGTTDLLAGWDAAVPVRLLREPRL